MRQHCRRVIGTDYNEGCRVKHQSHPTAGNYSLGNPAAGRICEGGMLICDRAIRPADIKDGLSQTMIVGEQSDWWVQSDGTLVDCGSGFDHGFCMGPSGGLGPSGECSKPANMTCVLHGVGEKSYNAMGVFQGGPNRPIQSAHPGGAMTLFCDGSVHFVTNSIDLVTLYNLVNRADGEIVSY